MIIDHDKKYMFLHVPKTGGTSIGKTLIKNGAHRIAMHWTASQAMSNLRNHKEYFIFAFIRNPYTRIASWYHYLKRENKKGRKKNRIDNPGTFKEFLMKYPDPKGRWSREIWLNQFDFLNSKMDIHVFKFEQIGLVWKGFAEKYNIKDELPHHKKQDYDIDSLYSEETKRIVRFKFSRDLKEFYPDDENKPFGETK